jgi:hypothetical protein
MFKAATVTFKERFSLRAGRRMGEVLLEKLGRRPDACWLFCTPGDDLQGMLKGIHDVVRTESLVGCTADGEIANTGFSTRSAVLGGISSDSIDFHAAYVENLARDSEEAGEELAKRLPATTAYVQLFSDGLTGNGCAILRGMESILGEYIPISGGTAGDAGRFIRTWQFAGTKLLSDAAVAIGFSGDFKLGTGVRSGWSPVGIPKKVTRAKGNVIYELNHQPALDVYERFLGKHAERLPAVGVEYPLGLVDPAGYILDKDYILLRATMSVNRQEGSITFSGEIPEGSMVRLTCGDHASILEGARSAARCALGELEDQAKPAMVFIYSCMARKIVLGRRTKEEIDLIRREVGEELPILGFYTYGEYCRVACGGPNLLHNETATVSIIGV